jgi:gliding motility-associated-like protein
MKKLINILFLLACNIGYTQHYPYLGPDQSLPYNVSSTILTADTSQYSLNNHPHQTTDYAVDSIMYVPQINNGTQLSMYDDSQLGPFNIGFDFCFFGQTYNKFYVGSNGWISFSPSQPPTFVPIVIPSDSIVVPKNCIMGPWQDWHPGVGGQIKYQTQGTAPFRKLIVSWIDMPFYQCTSVKGTFHIVIYESTNIIENHIQDKPNCLSWIGGKAIQGLHNEEGTIAVTTINRNSTQWVASNEAYRFTPNGSTILPTLTWYQVGNPNPIGYGSIIAVIPPIEGAEYTCHLEYPLCNGGWLPYNDSLTPDTVFIKPSVLDFPEPVIEVKHSNDLIYYVPNSFTPDGNKYNQMFKPVFTQGFDPYNYNLKIYNRWGKIIFESYDSNVGWDGTYNGTVCQNGGYLYEITFKGIDNTKKQIIRGNINLIK